MALCSRSKRWGVGRVSVEEKVAELRRLTAASETAGDNRSDDRRRRHRGVVVAREKRSMGFVCVCEEGVSESWGWVGLSPTRSDTIGPAI
jgi:hypothetical protein